MQGVKVEVFRHRLPKEGSGALDETNVWKATAGLSGQEHKGTSARNEVFGSIRQIPLTSALHKLKMQHVHFISHAEYFPLRWKIPEKISR